MAPPGPGSLPGASGALTGFGDAGHGALQPWGPTGTQVPSCSPGILGQIWGPILEQNPAGWRRGLDPAACRGQEAQEGGTGRVVCHQGATTPWEAAPCVPPASFSSSPFISHLICLLC